ncbi:ribonuclease H-like domain-containing protein [Rodentibacter haemolyticus]|uniref:Ribonuclease H-like domain-containing protein n=1 Tax=Rodentibacter haemolyticus TaxID=2778911 RepID=A0ABX6UWH5_9PAST|nr:ribonuclease H-like domain-containing protein [Rodentibacter haemolyticus]QPB42187.1 ribonuclease H-like domain-containing protein [Rodentibacter haemolyticus]
MNIYFDIETIPTQNATIAQKVLETLSPPANYKSEEAIQKWLEANKETAVEKTALSGTFGEIISVACAIDDSPVQVFYLADWQGADREQRILTDFFQYLNQHYQANKDIPPVFIGHNHVAFDIRFVYQRAIVNRVKPFAYFPIHAKAWDKQVFDTMVEWAGVGNRISMNDLCLALGIDGKSDDIDGSKVWGYVQSGRIAEVAEYNKADVERTRQIYKRMTFKE